MNLKPEEAKRVRGIEPPSLAWEANALPLSYTRSHSDLSLHIVQANFQSRENQSRGLDNPRRAACKASQFQDLASPKAKKWRTQVRPFLRVEHTQAAAVCFLLEFSNPRVSIPCVSIRLESTSLQFRITPERKRTTFTSRSDTSGAVPFTFGRGFSCRDCGTNNSG
jgi:hypothetical protein